MKAWLTHSFHCCAFKFPQRHDPLSYSKHMKLYENFMNKCKSKGYSMNDNRESSPDDSSHSNESINRKRRKRAKSNAVEDDEESGNNETYRYQSDVEDDAFDGGEFHAPAKLPNSSHVPNMCGNISFG